jgi:hypothetical protein
VDPVVSTFVLGHPQCMEQVGTRASEPTPPGFQDSAIGEEKADIANDWDNGGGFPVFQRKGPGSSLALALVWALQPGRLTIGGVVIEGYKPGQTAPGVSA